MLNKDRSLNINICVKKAVGVQQLQPFEAIYSLHQSLKSRSRRPYSNMCSHDEGCLIWYNGRFCILFCLLFLVSPTPFPLSLFKTRKGKNQKASASPPPSTTFPTLLLLDLRKQAERKRMMDTYGFDGECCYSLLYCR